MTLDEAIKNAEQMVEIGETYEVSIGVEEHRQLAEWLKDYKRLLEQEPKTGRWIYQHDSFSKWGGVTLCYKCSECGRQTEINFHKKELLLVKYPFCHCGADMRIKAESEGK